MVHWKIVPLIAGPVLLIPALLGAFRAVPAPASAEGTSSAQIAVATSMDAAPVLVEWAIRTSDLVTCETVTPELRRVRHQYGDRVRVVAYAVDTDVRLVQSFLRKERLARVDLQPRTERAFQADYARRFGSAASAPTLLVVSQGATAQTFDATARTTNGRQGIARFAAYLDGIVNRESLAGGPPPVSFTVRGD